MSQLSQAVITPTCQENRGRDGAWEEAVSRLRAFYEDTASSWDQHATQPTFTLTLDMQRPTTLIVPREYAAPVAEALGTCDRLELTHPQYAHCVNWSESTE